MRAGSRGYRIPDGAYPRQRRNGLRDAEDYVCARLHTGQLDRHARGIGEEVMDDLEKEIRRLYSFPNSNNTDIIAGLLLSLLFRIQELEKK